MPARTLLTMLVAILFARAAGAQEVSCEVTSDPFPADGSSDVPLNAMLAYPFMIPLESTGEPDSVLTLEGPGGVPIPITLDTSIGGDCAFAYHPDDDLEPLSAYTVRADGEIVAVFETGEARDESPPFCVVDEPDGEYDDITLDCGDDLVFLETGYGTTMMVNWVIFTPEDGAIEDQSWIVQHLNSGADLRLVAVDPAGNTTDVWIDGYDDGAGPEPRGATVNGCSTAPVASLGLPSILSLLLL